MNQKIRINFKDDEEGVSGGHIEFGNAEYKLSGDYFLLCDKLDSKWHVFPLSDIESFTAENL